MMTNARKSYADKQSSLYYDIIKAYRNYSKRWRTDARNIFLLNASFSMKCKTLRASNINLRE